jgi:hypothetical protein
MNRFAVACALGIVSGCASHPQPTYQPPALTVQLVFKQAPLENSVMRDGDIISYQVHTPPMLANGLPSVVQLQTDCSTPDVKMLFLDRYFSDRPDSSRVHQQLTPEVPKVLAAELTQNPSFGEACVRVAASDWRIVQRSEDQRWLMIDVNSVKTEGGVSHFWGAIDEPVLLSDKSNMELYGQSRERYEVDCTRQTYRVLSTFKLGKTHQVALGEVLNNPSQHAFAQAGAAVRQLLNTACGSTAQRSTLPAYTSRIKSPQSFTAAPVPASVLKAINDLKLSPPVRTLKRVVTRSSTYSGSGITLLLDTDPQSGQVRQRWKDAPVDRWTISFRGLITLAQQTPLADNRRSLPTSGATDTVQLGFTGDWQKMPVGAALEIRTEKRERHTLDGEGMLSERLLCTVERVFEASQVNQQLHGGAKEISCRFDNDPATSRGSKYYYLEEYGYFFRAAYPSGATTLLEVEE